MPSSETESAARSARARRRGRLLLIVSGVVFGLYLANVLVGKLPAAAGSASPLNIGDVPEFILLFLASASFAVAVIQLEIAAERDPGA